MHNQSLAVVTEAQATGFARIALGHVGREYPNKLDHVLTGPDDVLGPRALHPVFFGSLDWHSCVHGYWLLARVRRRFPLSPVSREITAWFAAHITTQAVAGECAYLARPASGGFERPYGWAWLLMLAAELARADAAEGATLQPLTTAIVARLHAWLPKATYPIRSGTHSSTAFALALALDYADTTADATLGMALRDKARAWYGADTNCQAWEPDGEDFLSPALMEAACMRRALPHAEFAPWLARFLPGLVVGEPATLFTPVTASDRTDGKIVHLDGLNLSRAWCWRILAGAMAPDDHRRPGALAAAAAHLDASLAHVTGHYMGEHWLASFALLALDTPADGAAHAMQA
jgi:hypothetical protein